ncbi:MAG: zinc metallopeptidase [Bacillota bacterium]
MDVNALYYMMGDQPLLLALIAVMILGFIAQGGVRRTFARYSQVRSASGRSASEIAGRLLSDAGSGATIARVGGRLTDHYDPRSNVVGLSEQVYDSDSVAALAVAAHEIGHVMQYEQGYVPIRIRNAILPVASFGSQAAPFIVIIGLLMGSFDLAFAGVILFGAVLVFQIVTLPVEFNASHRAIEMLTSGGYLGYDEATGAKRVLRAAAMTYVVAALASAITLLRFLMLANRNRRR